MKKSGTSERLIAVVSAFVAVAIVGVFGVADRTGDLPAVDAVALEADVRLQFELALRHDLPSYEAHIAALESTVEAYHRAPRTPGNQQLLVDWMQQAIRRTMPGSVRPLPTTPEFSLAVVENVQPPRVEPTDVPTAAADTSQAVAPVAAEGVIEPIVAADAEQREPAVAPLDGSASETVAETPADGADILLTDADRPAPPVVGGPVPTLADPSPGAAGPEKTVAVEVTFAPQREAAVGINLAELRARTTGYHAGLRDVAAAVAGEGVAVPRLAAAVTELEQLAARYEFVSLYYESLTTDEATTLPAPQTPATTARLLAVALNNATAPGGSDFDPFDAAAAEVVNQLRARLQAIADR